MSDLSLIIIYSLLSGSTVFLGGVLSHYFGDYFKNGIIKARIIHLSIAFGGGILLAAVGLVLVPEGMEVLSTVPILFCFSLGTISFFFLDRYMEKNGGTMS